MAQNESEEEPRDSKELQKEEKSEFGNRNVINQIPKRDKGNLGFSFSLKRGPDGFDFHFKFYWVGAGLLLLMAIIQVVSKYI